MDCSTPGCAVHDLLEIAQTHAHWVVDAIQPSHPLLPHSPPAFNLSQHQGLSQWVSSSHQLAKVLEIQHQSFHWIFRVDFLQDWLIWSPCSPKNSQESYPAPQFKSINSLALSFLYGLTLTSVHDWKKNIALTIWTFVGKNMFQFLNLLSTFVIVFLPRSKCPNSMTAVTVHSDFGTQENKSVSSTFSPI